MICGKSHAFMGDPFWFRGSKQQLGLLKSWAGFKEL